MSVHHKSFDEPGAQRLEDCAAQQDPTANDRLSELEDAWSRSQAAQVFLGAAAVGAAAYTLVRGRRGVLWVAAVGGLLVQNGLAGQDGLVNRFLKQLRCRTAQDLERERMAMGMQRGEFASERRVVDPADREAIERLEDEGGPPAQPTSLDRPAMPGHLRRARVVPGPN